MTAMIRAAVLVDDRRLEIRGFPRPTIGRNDGLLRVEASGICGTDVEQYHGAAQSLGQPYPAVLGREPVGVVEEVGEAAGRRWGIQPGDRVAVEPFFPCGHCEACRSGRYSGCDGRRPNLYSFAGTDVPPALWGGHAEYLYLHPNSILHRISPNLPADLAALFNPLGAGVAWAVQNRGPAWATTS
jgi:threonine dehydrogenase-like Zn-dependent dehydrogenase